MFFVFFLKKETKKGRENFNLNYKQWSYVKILIVLPLTFQWKISTVKNIKLLTNYNF